MGIITKIDCLWAEHFLPSPPQLDWSKFTPQTSVFHHVAALAPQPSTMPAFAEHCGLREYQWTLSPDGKPLFVCDNHNWALLALWELTQHCATPLPVVHIDAHRDAAICPHDLPAALTVTNIVATTRQCRVSDYLDVATRTGLITEIVSLTQSFEFADFTLPAAPFVLNLDLDIYV